jgi:hypothetical protein
VSNKKTTPERLTAFSDGVFSVIITIMVLNLKPPAEARQLFIRRDHLGEPSSSFDDLLMRRRLSLFGGTSSIFLWSR